MRISEWSSDVCSSDLVVGGDPVQVVAALDHGRGAVFGRRYARAALAHDGARTGGQDEQRQRGQARDEDAGRGYSGTFRRDHASCGSPVGPTAATDRKSVVSGKGVSVRVDLGGGRFFKKQK